MTNEFNFERFQKSGLVIDSFPVHHFKSRKLISLFWRKHFVSTILYPITPFWNYAPALRPFTQIAFYHGIQNGFMFGFLVTYTSWTLPLMVICLVVFLVDKIYLKSINNDLMFFLWISVSIWSSAFIRGWERTEKELAYNFDTFGFENLEPELYDHQGEYVVDEITREVTKYCRFNTFWKRRMVIPTFLPNSF